MSFVGTHDFPVGLLKEFHPNTARQPATRPVFCSLVAAVVKQAAAIARRTCPSVSARIHCLKKAVGAEAGIGDLRPRRARIRGVELP